jgi:hypothetical protein
MRNSAHLPIEEDSAENNFLEAMNGSQFLSNPSTSLSFHDLSPLKQLTADFDTSNDTFKYL